jgi:NADPH:quinone reductase-like Zn-dependent oxidoreductase
MADGNRVYRYRTEGAAFRLAREDGPRPEPGPGQVRVRVRASSLNYRDLIALRNKAGRPVDGVIPLSDGAGEVAEVGPGVSRVKVGDRVAGNFFQSWIDGPFRPEHHKHDLGGSLDGMLADEVVLDAEGVVAVPASLSFEEAACLPCAALTAWTALFPRGDLQPGEWVLIQGTGGVSISGLQLAVAHGARVVVTSSRDDKLARALAMGAAHGINYRTTPDWDREVWRLTEKRGVDHILEVGGPGTLGRSFGCIAGGGQIALIGVLTGFDAPQTSLFPLMARNARLDGIYVGSRADFAAMNADLAAKDLRPVIDRVFPFDEATAAFAHLESGAHFGKVVIRHD